MPKIAYKPSKLGTERLAVIARANAVIAEYEAQGFELTLRQLYYQFVARGWLPNTQRDYNRLGETLNEGRLCGLVDWHAIVDRTRYLRSHPGWDDPQEILQGAAGGYVRDHWVGQARRVEVWIEKDALVGVIQPVCDEWQVPYFSCRGYTSQSEMWSAAQRFRRRAADGQETRVLHLGDHDPSGMDMSRDIEDRIRLFMGRQEESFAFTRIALTTAQVQEYGPPPNPAKLTDSRAAGYLDAYGEESWELDALEPRVLANLIQAEVEAELDSAVWDEQVAREERERGQLTALAARWPEVATWLDKPRGRK